jgi:hypothetical protein
MRKWFFIALALFVAASARAEISPEGLWVSFDDDGKTSTALKKYSIRKLTSIQSVESAMTIEKIFH